jgi:redox-sensing transcriptional repressor
MNFAPTVISVPRGVNVRKVDLALELQILSYYEQTRNNGLRAVETGDQSDSLSA